MRRFFGIDLGTTNSAISCVTLNDDGQTQGTSVIEIEQNDSRRSLPPKTKTVPSCVWYTRQGQDPVIIVGDEARDMYSLYPEFVSKSIKSQMGAFAVKGLAPEVPDKTPEKISARILRFLREGAKKNSAIRQEVTEAVIAVPANFSVAAREATLRAAELAGLSVKEANGKWKPILISEPNAVLYDVAQKYLDTGEKVEGIDFSRPQHIIVFDMGGGTLDITFQVVAPSFGGAGLDITEIASARYSRIAGDLFDERAARFIYDRYLEIDRKRSTIMQRPPETSEVYQDLVSRRDNVLARLMPAAEELKIECNKIVCRTNERKNDDFFDADEEETVPVSKDVGNGHTVTVNVTPDEYLEIIKPLLGYGLRFDDYRKYSRKPGGDPENIIEPLLDVIAKAGRYFEAKGEAFRVDAVVLNGGMCNMLWIRERLKSFFGFSPVMTSNPEFSVANGAAVYSSLLESLSAEAKEQERLSEEAKKEEAKREGAKKAGERQIRIVRYNQNETLFLGLSAGARVTLISEGEKLPYSAQLTGFRILPGTKWLQLPIQRQTDRDHFLNIARCAMEIKINIAEPAPLTMFVDFDQSGLMYLDVKIVANEKEHIRHFAIELKAVDDKRGNKILPCANSILHPHNELTALKDCFTREARINKLASIRLDVIAGCANPKDFEEPVLKALDDTHNRGTYRQFLYHIAAALCGAWTETGREQLRKIAFNEIDTDRHGNIDRACAETLNALDGTEPSAPPRQSSGGTADDTV